MKDLRFEASDGEWRPAFTFEPERQAILAGSQKRFYKQLIAKADRRFSAHRKNRKAETRKVRWPGT